VDQMTINLLGGAVMAGLGWFARTLWDRQEAHGKELSDFRVLIARDYVSTVELNQIMTEVKGDLRYIRDRLDETPMRRQSDQK
jgi:hypothetical protein